MRTKFNEIINRVKTLFKDGFCPLNTDFEDLKSRNKIYDITFELNSIFKVINMFDMSYQMTYQIRLLNLRF